MNFTGEPMPIPITKRRVLRWVAYFLVIVAATIGYLRFHEHITIQAWVQAIPLYAQVALYLGLAGLLGLLLWYILYRN